MWRLHIELVTLHGQYTIDTEQDWGVPIWPSKENENFHFENELYIHTSSKSYEQSDYNLKLDSLIILHVFHIL